jgi:hypothetical protein
LARSPKLARATAVSVIGTCALKSVNGSYLVAEQDWITRLKAEGDTHIAVSTTHDYGENLGWAPRYPIHGLDLTQRVPKQRYVRTP